MTQEPWERAVLSITTFGTFRGTASPPVPARTALLYFVAGVVICASLYSRLHDSHRLSSTMTH